MKSILLSIAGTLLIVFATASLSAQGWEAVYPHEMGLSKGFDLQPLNDGGYIFVGEIDYPTSAIRHYIRLIRTNAQGNEIWSRIYGDGDIKQEEGRSVFPTSDGGFVIGGSSSCNPQFNPQFYLLRTNADGDSLWSRQYGGIEADFGRALVPASDDGFLLVGQSREQLNGDFSAYLVKVDALGDTLWTRRYYKTPFYVDARDAAETEDKGFIVTGGYQHGVFLLRTDANGDTLWTRSYYLSKADVGLGVAPAADGGFIVSGLSTGFAGNFPLIFKTDAEGTLEWQAYPTKVSFGVASDVIPTLEGNFALTGSQLDFWSTSLIDSSGFLLLLDAEGNETGTLRLPKDKLAQGAVVRQTSDGCFIIGGGADAGMYLLKTDSLCEIANETAQGPMRDAWNVVIYPQPAQEMIRLEIRGPAPASSFFFSLFDPSGRRVAQYSFTGPAFEIPSNGLPAGSYFYLIESKGNRIGSGKILIH